MTEPIKPALTPEEWNTKELLIAELHEDGVLLVGDYGAPRSVDGQERHALAALALYGQPFGFTRDDIALLRAYAHGGSDMRFQDLADRVEALLPPE